MNYHEDSQKIKLTQEQQDGIDLVEMEDIARLSGIPTEIVHEVLEDKRRQYGAEGMRNMLTQVILFHRQAHFIRARK